MDEKVDILMAGIRAIVVGESGSWREKRDAIMAKMDPDDADMFEEFISWFKKSRWTGPAVSGMEGTTMAEMYHATTVQVVPETNIGVAWHEPGKKFHFHIGEPCNDVTVMLDAEQLDRLVDTLIVAQHEHDIRTGRVVPDDGSGMTPGGEPVKTCQHGLDVQTCKACQGDLAYKLATR